MFIIGRFISTFGNWFASMAIPFIIYDLTGSAMAVSVSFLLETLPVILLSPLISKQIDNYSRKYFYSYAKQCPAYPYFVAF